MRAVALGVGVALLAGAAASLVFGAGPAAFPLAVWGVLVIVGVAFERWRYKRAQPTAGAGFEPTAERFIDPGSGRPIQVYADPRTGERRYVEG